MFKPSNFDATKKYPIVNYIYPGPQTGSVGSRNFSASRGDDMALAELGFIVVSIDGMGTPWRSKKFHEAYFGDMGDNTLPDQVGGMKQLAAANPWIDIDPRRRLGPLAAAASPRQTRCSATLTSSRWAGARAATTTIATTKTTGPKSGSAWTMPPTRRPMTSQANESIAKNLKGKLMLVHGTMDDNVPRQQHAAGGGCADEGPARISTCCWCRMRTMARPTRRCTSAVVVGITL